MATASTQSLCMIGVRRRALQIHTIQLLLRGGEHPKVRFSNLRGRRLNIGTITGDCMRNIVGEFWPASIVTIRNL